MSTASRLRRVVPVFAALGDATRLTLLDRLGDGAPRSITELSQGLDLTRQGVTKHLDVLGEAGMVTSRRVGRERRFRIRPGPMRRAREALALASAQWDESLGRLKLQVEGGGSAVRAPS